MTKLPVISGKKLIKILTKIGYYIRDQKGSHVHLRHPIRKPLTIPAHKTIARGTLRAIIRDADLTVDEFLRLLKEI
ncbi:MAG: type II toxin-antitoxin system HicA family toxin [Methanomassiliicoccales archaeon]|nr:MAG: type II toxin-antitoxin system HicA family toxin [Methanomassiliicoccales archaeon]